MSLLTLLQTRGTPPIQQALNGTLAMAGAPTFAVRTPLSLAGTLTFDGSLASMVMRSFVSLAGTLTITGAIASVFRAAKALAGTLTGSATLNSTYVPPAEGDGLTTLLRRNQTD